MQKNTILNMDSFFPGIMTLSNVLFVSKTSELKTTLQKYKYQGWGIYLAYALKNVLFEPGYAYKRYAYKKNM